MPVYDYKCDSCGVVHEARVSISERDRDDIACPACGAKGSRRLLSAPAVTGMGAMAEPPMPQCPAPT